MCKSMTILYFYYANVSKSPLIVLGTSPLSARLKAITSTRNPSCFSNIQTDCAYGWPLGVTLKRVPRYKIGNSFCLGFSFGRRRSAKTHCTSKSFLAALRPLPPPNVRAVRAVLADHFAGNLYTASHQVIKCA